MQIVKFPQNAIKENSEKAKNVLAYYGSVQKDNNPIFIKDEMTITKVVDIINQVLTHNNKDMFQKCMEECTDYLNKKEYEVLVKIPDFQYVMVCRDTEYWSKESYEDLKETEDPYDEKDTDVVCCLPKKTTGFDIEVYGRFLAGIRITNEEIIHPNNGEEIFNKLAHAIIHSILQINEQHGENFLKALKYINESLKINVPLRE